tara:strand:- start:2906 stop:3757 length:852 start_codon:yes stop_codon:yes gene_type:complete
MNIIKLPKKKVNDKSFHLRHCQRNDYDIVIDDNTLVYDSDNGELVLALIKKAITMDTAIKSYPALMTAKKGRGLRNRGAYSGIERANLYGKEGSSYAVPLHSYTGGFFERQGGRIPVCRRVKWTRDNPRAWGRVEGLLQEMSDVFKKHSPDKWDIQKKYVNTIHPDYHIPNTVYTTVAVNLSVAGAYHRDTGDFKDGLGSMCVFMKGKCVNWDLCIPEYGALLKIRDRDQILFNPHLLHGNTKGSGVGEIYKDWNRISVVAYVRERLTKCLSIEKELQRAREL